MKQDQADNLGSYVRVRVRRSQEEILQKWSVRPQVSVILGFFVSFSVVVSPGRLRTAFYPTLVS